MRSFPLRIVTASVLLLVAVPLLVHDMPLRLQAFFVGSDAPVPVSLFNGTFTQLENSITPGRLFEIAVVAPGGRLKVA